MSILKLKEAGEEVTLAVVTAERVQGDYGEQVKFTDKNGDVLFVPASSVERQLDRCGVAEIEELSGVSVHFSRAANNKKGGSPYWNLDRARNGDTVHTKSNGKPKSDYETPTRLPGEEPMETGAPPKGYTNGSSGGFDALLEKYGECLSEAVGFAQRIQKVGIQTDAAAVSSIAATLFIAREDARV